MQSTSLVWNSNTGYCSIKGNDTKQLFDKLYRLANIREAIHIPNNTRLKAWSEFKGQKTITITSPSRMDSRFGIRSRWNDTVRIVLVNLHEEHHAALQTIFASYNQPLITTRESHISPFHKYMINHVMQNLHNNEYKLSQRYYTAVCNIIYESGRVVRTFGKPNIDLRDAEKIVSNINTPLLNKVASLHLEFESVIDMSFFEKYVLP